MKTQKTEGEIETIGNEKEWQRSPRDDDEDNSAVDDEPEANVLEPYNLQDTGSSVTAQFSVPGGGASKKEIPINLISHGQEPWNKWGQA